MKQIEISGNIRNVLGDYGIYVVAFIAMLPILLMRDFTPDNELRYVSIAAESLRDGTFFAFTNHGVPYADKPPLYLWICMAGYRLFGNHCLPFVTLFSVIPAFVITQVMAEWSESSLSRQWRLPAKLMLLTSGLFVGLALTMRMDMLMAMFIVLALRTFWQCYEGDKSLRRRYLFPIYVFLALFSKGPYGVIIPLVSIVAFLAYKRRLRSFAHFWGWRCWSILVGLSALWFLAVYLEGGASYLDNLLFKQTMGRAVNSFAHDEPFYYYLISVWYSIAPWSPAVIGGIAAVLIVRRQWVGIPEPARFFIITSITTIVVLSCFSAKLAVYLLPAFPFLVYGGASAMSRLSNSNWMKAAVAFPAILIILVSAAVPFVSKVTDVKSMIGSIPATLATGVALLAVSATVSLILLLRKRNALADAVKALGFGVLVMLFFAGLSVGRFNEYIGYRDLSDKTEAALAATGIENVYTYRVRRPENMDVYLGRDVIVIDENEDGSVTMPPPGSGVLLMRAKDLRGTERVLGKSGRHVVTAL